MKKTFMASLVAGALAVFAATPVLAQDTIKVGIDAGVYPPFTYTDPSGKWVGWEVEFIEAVCAEAKLTCEITPTAWDGIIPALQEGKIDAIMSSMSITEERKQKVNFTQKYYNTPAHLIGPKSLDFKYDAGMMDNLKGKIVGVQAGTTHANFANAHFAPAGAEVKEYPKQEDANSDLVAGRVDLVLADSLALSDFLKSDQGKDFEVKGAPDGPEFGDGVGAAVRKEDTALLDKLNAAIDAIRASGKYDEITKKYFDFDIYGS